MTFVMCLSVYVKHGSDLMTFKACDIRIIVISMVKVRDGIMVIW